MPKHEPPIRDMGTAIQIDVKKGQYPFITLAVTEDDKLVVMVDANEGGQTINAGQNVAAIKLSKKKAQALGNFLLREFA